MLRQGPSEGASLDERLESMLAARVALYERFGPYMRATRLHRGRSAFLAAESRKLVLTLRDRLAHWMPELRRAPADLVEALSNERSR